MKKWYVDQTFIHNGREYDAGYYIREDGIIEWTEPIQNGETHEFPINECFHPLNYVSDEPGDPITVEDGDVLGKLVFEKLESDRISLKKSKG